MWILFVLLPILLFLRFLYLRASRKLSTYAFATPDRGATIPKILVVLGSGGHTTEMFHLIKSVLSKICCKWSFIVAADDVSSLERLESFKKEFNIACDCYNIQRSRKVGQNFLLAICPTFLSFLQCIRIILPNQPDLLLVNGPGTCAPVVFASLLVELFSSRKTAIWFCESFCRTKTTSLTAKLIRPFCDRFFVFWPDLLTKGDNLLN
jgi:beta-1,4-N-acetylglucosaminyltransferase